VTRISFRLAQHTSRDIEVVEVLCDGEVCGTIYPIEDSRMVLVSAHIRGVLHEDGTQSNPPIPTLLVDFNPEPYEIRHGRIVKPRRAQ